MPCRSCGTLPQGAGDHSARVGEGVRDCVPCDCINSAVIRHEQRPGDGGHIGAGNEVNQYVNLPDESRFVNTHPDRERYRDRLGHMVRVRVFHGRSTPGQIKYRLRPVQNNAGYTRATYSPSEYQNTSNFYLDNPRPDQWRTQQTAPQMTDLEVKVDAAGGNRYMIDIKCGDHECSEAIELGPVIVKRRIWIAPMRMGGVPSDRIPNLALFKDRFGDRFIEIGEFDRQIMSNFAHDQGNSEHRDRLVERAEQYLTSDAQRLASHLVGIVFLDQIAEQGTVRIQRQGITLSRDNPSYPLIELRGEGDGQRRYLWWDMGEPAAWRGDVFKFVYAGGSQELQLGREHVTPVQEGQGEVERSRIWKLRLNVNALLDSLNRSTVTGTLMLSIHVIDRVRGSHKIKLGYSPVGHSLIFIGTRYLWEPLDRTEIVNVLTHELSHQLGLVPGNDRQRARGLDDAPNFYEGCGHRGRHCHHGAPSLAASERYNAQNSANADCIMFGSSTEERREQREYNFCNDCSMALRKADLSTGFPLE